MQIITGFDSKTSIEDEKKRPLRQEYIKVFDALLHNKEVGENVFSRISKAKIREQVDHQIRRCRLDEVEDGALQWFAETSVALDLVGYDKSVLGGVLAKLVEDFGDYLLKVIIGDHSILVDSLNTKIIQTSGTLYQFRLKQRWAQNG